MQGTQQVLKLGSVPYHSNFNFEQLFIYVITIIRGPTVIDFSISCILFQNTMKTLRPVEGLGGGGGRLDAFLSRSFISHPRGPAFGTI